VTDPYLDANILVRTITQDDLARATRCQRYLRRLELGEEVAELTEATIAEVVYVLSSPRRYHLPRPAIRTFLAGVLAFPGVSIAHKGTYLRALELYEAHNVDFEDALIAAHMERTGTAAVVSFDRDFDRIPGITRRDPQ